MFLFYIFFPIYCYFCRSFKNKLLCAGDCNSSIISHNSSVQYQIVCIEKNVFDKLTGKVIFKLYCVCV